MFSIITSLNTLSVPVSLLSFWNFVNTMLALILFFHRSLKIYTFAFQSILFLLYRLGKFYWSVFKFSDSIFSCFYSAIENIQHDFIFFLLLLMCFSVLSCPFVVCVCVWNFLIFICFESLVIAYWSIFMMTA